MIPKGLRCGHCAHHLVLGAAASRVCVRTCCCRTSLFNKCVVSSNAPSVRLLGFTARLVELLNRISRCLRWEFGASEESGRCSQSVLCLLPAPPSGVCHFHQCPFHPVPAPLRSCARSPFSARASRFLISSLMLPIPSSCCLRPGATRRIR